MTSTVLARKYRPLSFEAMVGQGHVVQALANALTQQRLHHAYLFTGTRGVGKTTVSRILAKSLNCTGPDGQGGITATPCGQCQPCRDIDSGRFVDYVEMDAASNRGVEEISQLLDQAVYKPVVGRFKVYMIDEVHMLSNTAFNAMLKTLEEPPDYLKFVLATTDPQKVPVTVLSRCLQFNLRPMAMQTVQEHLEQVLTQEAVPFEPGALHLLARAARGSMRDGLSLTDQAIAYGAGRLDEAVVRQMLGSVDRQHLFTILDAVVDGDGPALIDAADNLRRLGLSAQGTLDDLAAALQNIAVLQTVPGLADSDPDKAPWLPLSRRLAPDECQLFYSLALHGRAELALAPDDHAGLLMVLLRWLAFKPAGDRERDHPKAEGPVAAKLAGPSVPVQPVAVREAPGVAVSAQAAVATVAPTVPAVRSSPQQPPVQAAVAPAPRPAQAPTSAPAPAAAPRAPTPDGVTSPDRATVPRAATPPPSSPPAPAPAPAAAQAPRQEQVPPWDDDIPVVDDEPSYMREVPFEHPAESRPIAAAARQAPPARQPVLAPEVPEPAMAAAPQAGQRTVVPVVPTTPLGDRWADLVARMQQDGLLAALVRELAMQAECVDVQESGGASVWRLRVERETLRGDTQRERLTAAVRKVLGDEANIELEAGVAKDTPALREQAARAGRQAAAEHLIQQDPLVNTLLAQYPGARIVSGSIAPL
ncbi:DNA polymerase III subunit gamma/tau [Aquabacterium soli]|uniref:DNA polymerase III subunit gamma/tau n=1 Tax=Aquabacterium soli TaxID=2493092 RepID=A0A3R8SAX3_9BURK|nr:DNA polymerase III subunit gamma/tau [Aquabacterium soli]RRS05432.1 DNA polymerase III subunit gamma/tau [Aquabacterium soli]